MDKKKIQTTVEKIISDVRKKGDTALFGITKKFDRFNLNAKNIRVKKSEFTKGFERLAPEIKKSLAACARRIQDFHWEEKKHLPQSWATVKSGVRLGQLYKPMESVGVYVPGGRFSYPSTLLMTVIPARLAGVSRIAVITPPGKLTDEICAAAHIAGVSEMYRVGGPAGLAALALGTKSIPKVDFIIGPGNALVTEAKRQLFGEVGIDLLAGPSELVVLTDGSAKPAYVAADLAAQAEHDPDACGILISTSKTFLNEVKKQIPKTLIRQCELIYQKSMPKAVAIANEKAGEHVQVIVKRPSECLDHLKNAGALFINSWSPAVMGDYWAGPSHVLPTGRAARYCSGLSLLTFLKRSSLIEVTEAAYKENWKAPYTVAQAEGLVNHAKSIKVRVSEEK